MVSVITFLYVPETQDPNFHICEMGTWTELSRGLPREDP